VAVETSHKSVLRASLSHSPTERSTQAIPGIPASDLKTWVIEESMGFCIHGGALLANSTIVPLP